MDYYTRTIMKIIAFPVRAAQSSPEIFRQLPIKPNQRAAFKSITKICADLADSQTEAWNWVNLRQMAEKQCTKEVAFNLIASLYICKADPAKKYDTIIDVVFFTLALNLSSGSPLSELSVKQPSYLTSISKGILWWGNIIAVLITRSLFATNASSLEELRDKFKQAFLISGTNEAASSIKYNGSATNSVGKICVSIEE
jgi:hypothetical protein